MLVLLLACGNVWAQSYSISEGAGALSKEEKWEVTFGQSIESFMTRFFSGATKILNSDDNKEEDIDFSKFTLYIRQNGEIFDFGYNTQNKEINDQITSGLFKYALMYNNKLISSYGNPYDLYLGTSNGGEIELVVNPLSITMDIPLTFHCYYNGTNEFTVNADFCTDSKDRVDVETFKSNCNTILKQQLPSFDQTTEIDFDNTIFTFNSKNADPNPQDYTVHWVLKSNSDSEDWTANYEFSDGSGRGNIHPRPITANVTVSSKVYDGTPAVLSEQNIVGDIALDNVVQGDDIAASVVWSSIYGSLSYESEGVGDNKKINGFENASLITLSGVDAGNYQITEVDAKSSITAKIPCPYSSDELTWGCEDVNPVSGSVTLYNGDNKVGFEQQDGSLVWYGLWANRIQDSQIGYDFATYSYKKVDANDYVPYTMGTSLKVGAYSFIATYAPDDAHSSTYENCVTEPVEVIVQPYTVVPNPKYNSTKEYDGTTTVLGVEDEVSEFEIYAGDVLVATNDFVFDDDDFKIVVTSASYDEANAGERQITFTYKLEPQQEYYVVEQEHRFDGAITPLTPSVEWLYNGQKCVDQSKQEIEYGTDIALISTKLGDGFNSVYSSIYDNNRSYSNAISSCGGETEDGKLLPGVYRRSVYYDVNEINNNLLNCTSSIEVIVKKVDIQLKASFSKEMEYGVKVKELTYEAINQFSESQIKYSYYISKDESSLFSDDNKIDDENYTPEKGTYWFGCIATDVTGCYMNESRKSEKIVITKAGGYFKIDEPVIEEYKTYDGDYYAKVVTPAKFGDIEFETTAYYVDKSITESTEISDEYFRSDVGTYYICYKFIIPEEVLEQYNLCIDSYEDDNGNIQPVPYVSGSYRYHNDGCKPGSIRCGSLELEVEFPTADHSFTYGDEFMLGGSRDQDVKVYTKMVNGDYVFNIDGEFEFADFSVNPYTPLAYPLYVNTYNNIQVRLTVPDGSNYCGMFESAPFDFTVTPKPLTFEGDFVIADKTYDGSDIINSDEVNGNLKGGDFVQSQFPETQQIRSVPNVVGILASDKPYVTAVWDFSDTKYPSAEVKYTDDTQSEVAAYTGIPASVSLTGSRAYNYKLPDNTTVYGSSKINPAIQIEFESPEQPEDVLTYRLVYGNSVLGEDFKVKDELVGDGQYVRYIQDGRYNRTFLMQSPKVNSDDYYNFEAQIVEGNREDDMYKDNVKIIASQKFKLYVDRLKLIVSEPEIEKIKLYDGNTSVKWIDDNNKCRLTNVVGDDDVRLEDIDIQYDSPEVGGGKTITARYAVGGNHLYKYILPDDYSTVGAISSGDVTIVDVTPVTGDGGSGTVSPNNDGYCAGEDIMLNIKISEGIPVGCSIEFDDAAKKAGFENVTNANVVDAGDGVYQVTIDCPKAAYGKYGGKLYLEDFTGKESDGFSFEIMVNYPSKYLRQKFDDVILVDNHFMSDNEQQHLFSEYNPDVSYQWYVRNNGVDTDITGETKQFYNTTTPGVYGAYALTSSGERIKICPIKFPIDNVSKSVVVSKSVTTYPNPARSMETVTIKLHGFDSDSYKDVVIYVYNSVGSIVTTIKNVDVLNTVNLPSGNYSGIVVFDGNKIPFKFIVRN